jgi:hypothetical protein
MSDKAYAVCAVSVDGSTVKCDPDLVQCYWETGPANIRWTFENVPANVTRVEVRWKDGGAGYVNKPMFSGQDRVNSTVGARLDDVVTSGNCKIKGKFRYEVLCYDAAGKQVASVDPDAGNDPNPPIGP